jgi:enoyl-[acyl-carrier-protein] reductase (NADH)
VHDVLLPAAALIAPPRRDPDLGGAGSYLLSDLSTGVTGEIHLVDSGYNIIVTPHPERPKGGCRQAQVAEE